MKLPRSDKATIPRKKLENYLLSATHPVGGPKARFFHRHGFTRTDASTLEAGLLRIGREEEVSEVQRVSHGTKYVIDAELETPAGRTVLVRTIWIIEEEEDPPRLVTAYPL